MKLSEKRVLFTELLCDLVLWGRSMGLKLAFGEGYVALTDAADGDWDGPHKKDGAHYTGLGSDLIMYDPITWLPVEDGGDPRWTLLGTRWESMDPLCRWGGRFNDANHFSLFHEGRA